jgi:hypothetical protein
MSMKSTLLTALAVNELLAGFTTVEAMSFASLSPENQCDLTFALRRDSVDEGPLLSLRFHGVALLHVSGFGGELTQVMCLRVEDVREGQWEHLHYSVSDLEDDRVRFLCRSIECIESSL